MSPHEPNAFVLSPDETMPNSPLPVLVYRQVLPGGAGDFALLFERNGWRGIWRDGIYDFEHFHSNAHEALGVARGRVTLQLGGESGRRVTLETGDAVVLPAGTGHRALDRAEGFVAIGAYPAGQERYDICRRRSPETELRIDRLKRPATDPINGPDGPLMRHWS